MKSIALLILGCLPLAAITLAALLGVDESYERTPHPSGSPRPADIDLRPLDQKATGWKPALDALSQADPFRTPAIPALEGASSDSTLRPLTVHWLEWTLAKELIGNLLEAEGLTAGPGVPEWERAAEQFGKLSQRFATQGHSVSQPLRSAITERAAETRQRIDLEKRRAECQSLLKQAEQELTEEHYLQCVRLCEHLLSPTFTTALAEGMAEKVRLLQHRAEFGRDVQRTVAAGRAPDGEIRQNEALRALIETYGASKSLTAPQAVVLESYRQQLRAIDQRQESERTIRRAQEAVTALERSPPVDFESRLTRALQLAGDYPVGSVKTRLAGNVRRWIADFLPDKTTAEPPELREAETTTGEIIRGYFQTVNDSHGLLTGYQRYLTLEQLRHPVSAVGTFPVSAFKSPPQASVPRRCADRYHEARARVLESPHEAERWAQLAEVCKDLDRELNRYRALSGAAEIRMSFAAESRFAAAAGQMPSLSQLKTLFPPGP